MNNLTSKSNKSLFRNLKRLMKSSNEITLQRVISDSYYHKSKGWIKTNLNDEDYNVLCGIIANSVIGGRKVNTITRILQYRNSYHWALDRIKFDSYDNFKTIRISYCAGQDYPYELNQLRHYLYNN